MHYIKLFSKIISLSKLTSVGYFESKWNNLMKLIFLISSNCLLYISNASNFIHNFHLLHEHNISIWRYGPVLESPSRVAGGTASPSSWAIVKGWEGSSCSITGLPLPRTYTRGQAGAASCPSWAIDSGTPAAVKTPTLQSRRKRKARVSHGGGGLLVAGAKAGNEKKKKKRSSYLKNALIEASQS